MNATVRECSETFQIERVRIRDSNNVHHTQDDRPVGFRHATFRDVRTRDSMQLRVKIIYQGRPQLSAQVPIKDPVNTAGRGINGVTSVVFRVDITRMRRQSQAATGAGILIGKGPLATLTRSAYGIDPSEIFRRNGIVNLCLRNV